MNFLKLTQSKLDLNEINALVVHETCGGVSFFIGTTRDSFEDKKVTSLEYEAYDTMAMQTLTKICDQMRDKWDDIHHIAIYHRLGLVPVKEASVIIGVSSPHRKTSLDAVQYAIEELKKSVPIWKKEQYSDPEAKKSAKRKLPQLNFDDCQVDDEPLPKCLVQIGVDEAEVQRRVSCFVDRKREEIDINNIRDFIDNEKMNTEAECSCARINSTVYRKGVGSHLKVHRVRNEYGPQTNTEEYTGTLDKLMSTSPSKIKQEMPSVAPSRIEERLVNAERFLNVKTEVNRNIYERIKSIEDRILHLETVSPEYNHFLQKNTTGIAVNTPKIQKKTYTAAELEKYILDME
ncbi:molybdopterin synthase catalytic subunit isoform X1 [Bradysia coprophila]|uniref:molybdopterin synthase catalytic subunit isoform X1 n=1 Tax=Bradysia coprophila TaxID=38358 RepID=UPI00187DCFAF|nr:molybdopterin synthase catalytic subunit isoform X1 [Bradysia coprophila]